MNLSGGSSLWDLGILLWFALTIPSVLYVAYDLITNTPEMGVMKWAGSWSPCTRGSSA